MFHLHLIGPRQQIHECEQQPVVEFNYMVCIRICTTALNYIFHESYFNNDARMTRVTMTMTLHKGIGYLWIKMTSNKFKVSCGQRSDKGMFGQHTGAVYEGLSRCQLLLWLLLITHSRNIVSLWSIPSMHKSYDCGKFVNKKIGHNRVRISFILFLAAWFNNYGYKQTL